MNKSVSGTSKFLVVATVCAVFLIAGAIFYYYNFFRQTNAKLIETVPTDATFVFMVNDNESFAQNVSKLAPYMEDLFALDTYVGFQSFLDKCPAKTAKNSADVIISSHSIADEQVLLFSTEMTANDFSKLLKILKIDSRNCAVYENTNIYISAAHFHKYHFAWHHNVFSVSENIELLKKCIDQHRQVRNLAQNEDFRKMLDLVRKNTKQNWLLLNCADYAKCMAENLNDNAKSFINALNLSTWAAYQLTFTDNELKMAGYVLAPDNDGSRGTALFNGSVPVASLPSDVRFFVAVGGNEPACYFSLSKDSVSYYYAAVQRDTNDFAVEDLLPDGLTLDSCAKYKGVRMFALNPAALALPAFYSDFAKSNFLENDGNCIISDTLPALRYYVDVMAQQSMLDDSRSYRAVNENLPSDFSYRAAYFFNTVSSCAYLFSETGLKTDLAKGISIAAISFSQPENGIATSNVYLKF